MRTFQDILQTRGDEFVNNLMDNYVIVYEKLNASTLCVKRIGDKLHFYKGNDKEEITDINITLYNYFSAGIEHLERVSLIFYREMPEGWLFKFNYFIDNCTDIITYDYLPQNNLVLNCIINNSNVIDDCDVLKRWAERFQTDYMKPVFQGFLSSFQKDKISEYIKTPVDGVSFAQYIMSVLNPSVNHTLYCNGFGNAVGGFVFKFFTSNDEKTISAKIMDPYITSLLASQKEEKSKYNGENELIIVSFLAYLQTVDLNDIKVDGATDEERYMNMLCKLFNGYIQKEHKLFGVQLDKKEKKELKESYAVNVDRLDNKETIELLNNHPSLHNVFQIIVGTFTDTKDERRASESSLLNKDTLNILNDNIEKIQKIVKTPEEPIKTFADMMNDEIKKKEKEVETEEVKNDDDVVMDFRTFMKKQGVDIDKEDDGKEEVKHKEEKKKKEDKPKKEEKEEKKDDEEKKDVKEEDKQEEDEKHEEKEEEKKDTEDEKEEKKDDKEEEVKEDEKQEDGSKDEEKEEEPNEEVKEELPKEEKKEETPKEENKEEKPKEKEEKPKKEKPKKEDNGDNEPELTL